MYTTIRPKIRVLINLFIFICAHNHSNKVRSHSYSLNDSFLCQYSVCYVQGSTSLISRSLFSGSSAFIFRIHCIHSSTTLIIRILYSCKYCSYISYAISMAIWSLSPMFKYPMCIALIRSWASYKNHTPVVTTWLYGVSCKIGEDGKMNSHFL